MSVMDTRSTLPVARAAVDPSTSGGMLGGLGGIMAQIAQMVAQQQQPGAQAPAAPAPTPPAAPAPPAATQADPFAQLGQVQAPPTPDQYRLALQQAFAPQFSDEQNALAATEASKGILDGTGGRKDFSDLGARQSATVAQAMMPLITQGFGQQFNAANANAASRNAYLEQLTGIGANQTSQNASMQEQSNLANLGLWGQLAQGNQSAQNNLQLAQLGYGNQDYLAQLNALYGLEQTGLGGLSNVFRGGMDTMYGAYSGGQALGTNAAGTIGQNAGYGATGSTPIAYDSSGNPVYDNAGTPSFSGGTMDVSGNGGGPVVQNGVYQPTGGYDPVNIDPTLLGLGGGS